MFKEIVILELESIMRLGSCLMSFFLIAQTLFVLLYVPSFSHKVYTCIDFTRLDSQVSSNGVTRIVFVVFQFASFFHAYEGLIS